MWLQQGVMPRGCVSRFACPRTLSAPVSGTGCLKLFQLLPLSRNSHFQKTRLPYGKHKRPVETPVFKIPSETNNGSRTLPGCHVAASEDIARQIRVGSKIAHVLAHVFGIDHDGRTAPIRRVERNLVQNPFHHGLQAAGADILDR